MTLNRYGDEDFSPTDMFGVDVSSQRLDELDIRALTYVVERHGQEPFGIDLGCGLGTPSIAFALAGATMLLVDAYDFSPRFRQLAATVPLPRLVFLQRELSALSSADLPESLAFAYSQRTLHYLRFDDAGRALRLLSDRLGPNAPVYISLSGLNSELGEGYRGAPSPIENRFALLAPQVAEKHHIFPEVCLYDEDGVAKLAERSGLHIVDIWISPFGNIKAELVKP